MTCRWRCRPVPSRRRNKPSVRPGWRPRRYSFSRRLARNRPSGLTRAGCALGESRALPVLVASGLISVAQGSGVAAGGALSLLSPGVNEPRSPFRMVPHAVPAGSAKRWIPQTPPPTRPSKEFPRPDRPASSRPRRTCRSKFFRFPGPPRCFGRSHARGVSVAFCGLPSASRRRNGPAETQTKGDTSWLSPSEPSPNRTTAPSPVP